MTTWLDRMNWSFLNEEDAEAVWNEARRLFFDQDRPLDTAFADALRSRGFTVEGPTAEDE